MGESLYSLVVSSLGSSFRPFSFANTKISAVLLAIILRQFRRHGLFSFRCGGSNCRHIRNGAQNFRGGNTRADRCGIGNLALARFARCLLNREVQFQLRAQAQTKPDQPA